MFNATLIDLRKFNIILSCYENSRVMHTSQSRTSPSSSVTCEKIKPNYTAANETLTHLCRHLLAVFSITARLCPPGMLVVLISLVCCGSSRHRHSYVYLQCLIHICSEGMDIPVAKLFDWWEWVGLRQRPLLYIYTCCTGKCGRFPSRLTEILSNFTSLVLFYP